jgi:hypothetical protein
MLTKRFKPGGGLLCVAAFNFKRKKAWLITHHKIHFSLPFAPVMD